MSDNQELEKDISFDETEIETSQKKSAKSNSNKKPIKKKRNPIVAALFPSSNKNKTQDGKILPKTAQDTIPYINAYRSGIIESKPGYFTKSYKLTDINFRVASYEDQEKIFDKYKEFLASLGADTDLQIVINNRNEDENSIIDSIMCKMEADEYNEYRVEMNDMIRNKMSEGRNNLVSEKYAVIGTRKDSIRDVQIAFSRIDTEIDQKFKDISNSQEIRTEPQTIQERLKCIHDIINAGKEKNMPVERFDFDELSKQGLTTKDLIAPSGFRFDSNDFRMGDKWGRALFIKVLPSSMNTDFMADLSGLPFNLTATFNIIPIAQDKALKMVSRQLTNIRANVIKAQKDAYKAGYSGDLISPELTYSQNQAEELLDAMKSGGQKLFFFNGVIMHYADSKEELDKDTDSIVGLGNRYLMTIDRLTFQQEVGFKTALPLGINDLSEQLSIETLLPTDSVSLFIPFTSKELMQKGGMYYGLNAVSHNLLLFNRLNSKNQNGLILGQPGSGKSFSAKREMINVFLTTKDDIYVIDPESEYAYMAKLLGGSVIHLEAGAKVYINPFDMDIQYGDEEGKSGTDPVKMKSDYICMLCESAMGGSYEITTIQKSIIDRVVIQLYKPYLKHMRELNDSSITCDTSASPTMEQFYTLLMDQPEPEAQNIALSLEIYCLGSFDTFAHKTNVDVNNRFTVYDIKDIGNGMKEMGLQVCLNHIWNKIIDNQKKNKRTWFYIDEFHVLTKTRSSAEFLQQIWKRARKWGGIPTAITQNVEDLLKSEESRAIINNCEFIMMLSQSPIDRASLASMYHISDAQLNYITNSPPGQGLIYNGEGIIPFIDKFPKETKLYKIMSSKPGERLMDSDLKTA